jgi:hypothetical protein
VAKIPCSKYKGSQRKLCFATKGWKDWSKVKEFKKERKEHPTLSKSSIKTIVKDHSKKR